MASMTVLQQCHDKMRELVAQRHLDHVQVAVKARPLTPEEAIGAPTRRDYPILEGKEQVVQATVLEARGQAFTDSPSDISCQLGQVLALPLDQNRNRAIFLATMNALMASLNMVEGVLHCKDDHPERCAARMASQALDQGARTVGLIGLNPAIAEALVREFGPDAVCITDLNPRNIGQRRFGVAIWDGRTETRQLISACDLILVTGTALANGTFDAILQEASAQAKRLVVFGITGAAVCQLLGMERWCFEAQTEIRNNRSSPGSV
ncbi:MAG: Rossmann-like domain-containing protein [Acidobacteriaceae bacterium]